MTLDLAGADDLKKLRANSTGKTIVVDFWSTKCKDCSDEFDDFETTYGMFRLRKFDLITVSTDNPSAKSQVMDFLKQQHASGTNLQFDSADTRALQAAVGAKWKLGEPFMIMIGPDGNVVFQKAGEVDILRVRRHVLATIPNEGPWAGVRNTDLRDSRKLTFASISPLEFPAKVRWASRTSSGFSPTLQGGIRPVNPYGRQPRTCAGKLEGDSWVEGQQVAGDTCPAFQ